MGHLQWHVLISFNVPNNPEEQALFFPFCLCDGAKTISVRIIQIQKDNPLYASPISPLLSPPKDEKFLLEKGPNWSATGGQVRVKESLISYCYKMEEKTLQEEEVKERAIGTWGKKGFNIFYGQCICISLKFTEEKWEINRLVLLIVACWTVLSQCITLKILSFKVAHLRMFGSREYKWPS